MTEEYGTIKVPKRIIDQIEGRLPETDFKSVGEYATFVLDEVLKELFEKRAEAVHSEEDERKIKERLKALGYLD